METQQTHGVNGGDVSLVNEELDRRRIDGVVGRESEHERKNLALFSEAVIEVEFDIEYR